MESVAVISPDVRILELKLLLKPDVRTGFVVSQRRCRIMKVEGDSFKMLGLGSSKFNTYQRVLTFEF